MKNILLITSGDTPQVITETLYVILAKEKIIPDEIHVITTTRGFGKIKENLIGNKNGRYFEMCRDYKVNPSRIKFDDSTIHIIENESGPMDDIRDSNDNLIAADLIFNIVKSLTSDKDTALHASIAGGRKTMSAYLALAMQIFGRKLDRLSHVLVHPDYESGLFFYPPKKDFEIRTRDGRTVRAKDAIIELADIKFVRLGEHFAQDDDGHGHLSETAVESINEQLKDFGVLTFDPINERLSMNGYVVDLSPAEGCIYHCLLDRIIASELIPAGELHDEYMESYIEAHFPAMSGKKDKMINDLRNRRVKSVIKEEIIEEMKARSESPEDQDRISTRLNEEVLRWFASCKSRINKKIARDMPPEVANLCQIEQTGPHGKSIFSIPISKNKIRILHTDKIKIDLEGTSQENAEGDDW